MTDLSAKLKRIISDCENLEQELKPYLDLWSETCKAQPKGSHDFWSYPGPHDRADYKIDFQGSTDFGLLYVGRDYDGDFHEFTLPFDFIEKSEEKAAELVILQEAKAEEQRREAEERRARVEEQNRQRRLKQYEELKKEFG